MKVIVFENEYQDLQTCFLAVNLVYFDNQLNILNYSSSQACPDISMIEKDACVFVDIDLSSNSMMDGFELIEELIKYNFPRSNIVILTGHVHIVEKSVERGLDDLLCLTKPINFELLRTAIEKIIK